MSKYELLITMPFYREVGKTHLYRIKALKDFADVKKGDIGGFVESEYNLSQSGNCWIYDDAKVYGRARVLDDAKIKDNARVYDNATIFDNCIIKDEAQVYGYSSIYNSAKVYGHAKVCGSARVVNNAQVFDNSVVLSNAIVCNSATVRENAMVGNHAYISQQSDIYGDAVILGHSSLYGNSKVYGNAKLTKYFSYINADISSPYDITSLNFLEYKFDFFSHRKIGNPSYSIFLNGASCSEEHFIKYVNDEFSNHPRIKKLILDTFTINKLKMTQP